MGIRVGCNACQASFMAKDEHAGRQGKCPKCGAPLTVPHKPSAAAPATAVGNTVAVAGETTTVSPAKTTAQPNFQARLLAGITGPIEPVRTSILYRVGMVWAAGVMIVLPLIYIALIALAAWAVYYHAVYDIGMLGFVRGRGAILMVALYAAPIIAGVIMVVFMVKPLLAAPAEEGRSRFLTRHGEPLLFEFVDKLCQSVGAPLPSKIEVDNQLNASAKYGSGWRGLFGGDLVLTIGAPLAAGLSLEQFSGVLAHEFGHFSQGMAMRMTFLVRGISHWFVRVVYHRDQWDAWLESAHEDTDWRWAMVMLLAQFCVFISRGVLWLLMMFGNLTAGFLLRQMEYDADLHEMRFVGSKVFESTTLRLRTLNKTYGDAMKEMVGHLNRGRLPDNLSKLILAHAAVLPEKAAASQRKSLAKERTGLFDTHPCDRERIAAAEREAAPGVFRCEGEAALLFGNFEAMCRGVTGDFYRGIFGSQFNPRDMHPTEALSP